MRKEDGRIETIKVNIHTLVTMKDESFGSDEDCSYFLAVEL